MAERQELEINISKEGDVQIHVKGKSGKKCFDLTAGLEEALGLVTSREFTSEYYKNEETSDNTVNLKDTL